jgi:hypothetical protein
VLDVLLATALTVVALAVTTFTAHTVRALYQGQG